MFISMRYTDAKKGNIKGIMALRISVHGTVTETQKNKILFMRRDKMSRYRMNIVCDFDTDKPVQDFTTKNLINGCCPQDFDLFCAEYCARADCVSCWFDAVERGVISGSKSVHVERLD